MPTNISAIVSTLVGITAITMFYRKNLNYDKLFYTWIIMQFPFIGSIDPSGNVTYFIDAFPNALGRIHLSFGRMVKEEDRIFFIKINMVPVLLLALFNFLNAGKSVGQNLIIHRLKKDSFRNNDFPFFGNIEELVGWSKARPIYRVALDKEMVLNAKPYKYALLQPKDRFVIATNGEEQVCGLRLLESKDGPYGEKENPFINWVTTEIKRA